MFHLMLGFTFLASLASLAHGRRVQASILPTLHSGTSGASSAAQSFAEVAAAFTPSAPGAHVRARDHAGMRSPPMAIDSSGRGRPGPISMNIAGGTGDSVNVLESDQGIDLSKATPKVVPIKQHVSNSMHVEVVDGTHSVAAHEKASIEEHIEIQNEEGKDSQSSTRMFGFVAVSQIMARIALTIRRARGNSDDATNKGVPFDASLWVCVVLWYVGNYYYNISNKIALTVAGGASGFPITIATSQLAVGCVYAILLWVLPDARQRPSITFDDWKKSFPVGLFTAGQHAAAVFALSAGAVSFAQVIKAAEPVFAAVIAAVLYKHPVSKAKWMCLFTLIGGVALASVSELTFTWAALVTASLANVFAAFSKNEAKELMERPGINDRIGSTGNQFAITMLNSFMLSVPLMLLTEGHKLGAFVQLCRQSPVLFQNIIFSGLWCYMYCELATIVIRKTSAVTQSVLTTLKRVLIIGGMAIVLGESLPPLKILGCSIAILSAFLYSIIDKLLRRNTSTGEERIEHSNEPSGVVKGAC